MAAVAAAAVTMAWIGVVEAIALVAMAAIALSPIPCAPPGHRLDVALWAIALLPAMGLVSLYASWVTAWCVLGHRPRVYLDDPKYLSPLVAVPHFMAWFSFIAWPFSLGAGFTLAAVSAAQRRWRSVVYPLVLLPLAWLSAIVTIRADPLDILDWFFD
jgi:hypothetical protein